MYSCSVHLHSAVLAADWLTKHVQSVSWLCESVYNSSAQKKSVLLCLGMEQANDELHVEDPAVEDESDHQSDDDTDNSDDEQMTFQNIIAVLVGRQSLGGLR